MPQFDLRSLTRAELDELNKRLLLFAHKRISRCFWRGEPSGPLPGGMTAQDFVYQAFQKTKDGTRKWNERATLFQHLAGVISSDISHLATSAENKRTTLASNVIDLDEYKEGNYVSRINIYELEDHYSNTPERNAIISSETQSILSYLNEIDTRLRIIAELIFEGYTFAQAARELNMNESQRDDSLKRLKKKMREYIDMEGQHRIQERKADNVDR
jgi:RNA polymerase sigma factor (sigma-70 family)